MVVHYFPQPSVCAALCLSNGTVAVTFIRQTFLFYISKAGLKHTQVSVLGRGRESPKIMQYVHTVRHSPYHSVKLVSCISAAAACPVAAMTYGAVQWGIPRASVSFCFLQGPRSVGAGGCAALGSHLTRTSKQKAAPGCQIVPGFRSNPCESSEVNMVSTRNHKSVLICLKLCPAFFFFFLSKLGLCSRFVTKPKANTTGFQV